MLLIFGLPKLFEGEALETATYFINPVVLLISKFPEQMLFGPYLSYSTRSLTETNHWIIGSVV